MDVGAEIEFRRKDSVPASMPREECDTPPAKIANHITVRRFSKRRFQCDLTRLSEAFHLIETAAADNPNLGSRGRSVSQNKCSDEGKVNSRLYKTVAGR
jgi:hypothetical protein